MKSSQPKIISSDDFPRRLEAEMNRVGLTQSALASRLKISQGTVSGWFRLDARPQPRIAQALGELLGVRPEWLIKGKLPREAPMDVISNVSELIHSRNQTDPSSSAETIRSEIRRRFEETLSLAGDDVGRLGWMREQVIRHMSAPEHWDIHEHVIRKVLAEEKAAETQRAQSPRAHGKAS